MIHEDDRRILESWPEAKVITAKTLCELGNHYHKIKTEKFILISGKVDIIIPEGFAYKMELGQWYTVLPNEIHAFIMGAGSVMIGLCSHPYDPTDDYK